MPLSASNEQGSRAGNESMEVVISSSTGTSDAGQDEKIDAQAHAVLAMAQHRLSTETLSETALLSLCAQTAMDATFGQAACVQLRRADGIPVFGWAGTEWPLEPTLQSMPESTGWWGFSSDGVTPLKRLDEGRSPTPDGGVLLHMVLRCSSTEVGAITVALLDGTKCFNVRDRAHLEILAQIVSAHLQVREVADELRASRQQYLQLFEAHPLPMYVFSRDSSLRFLAVNDAAVQQYGYSRQDFLRMELPALWPQDRREAALLDANERINTGFFNTVNRVHQRCDGTRIDVEINSRAFLFDGQPALQAIATDVTERLAAERELANMARARHLLSACNEAMVRANAESDLLEAVCAITVNIGGYRMAWIGLAQHDAARSIACVAQAGVNHGYLESLTLSWDADSPDGQGPSGVVIRTGKAVVVQDVRRTSSFPNLTERLVRRGYFGMVCLPLRDGDQTFGILYLYAPEVLNLSAQEVELLGELAQDLAFGLTRLRARQDQQRMQKAVLKVAASVSASTGNAFFRDLALNMAQAVNADSACIGRFLRSETSRPEKLETLALVVNGKLVPNAHFFLAGTPSEKLTTEQQLCVEAHLREEFPRSPVIDQTVAEAYVGQQLADSNGTVTGVLFVLFKGRLHNAAFVQSTLQIFASRVSAEMERQLADQHILWQASMLDQAQDAIVVLDMAQRVTYWNKGAEHLYGWTSSEVLGRPVNQLLHLSDTEFQVAAAQVAKDGEWAGEMVKQHRDGTSIDTEGRWTLVRGTSGEPNSVLAISTDIRERKSTQERIQRLAFYDVLTGLPNRILLMDHARNALAQAAQNRTGGAMLFIDLDNFKTLNDTLGHDKGDMLLQQVAGRLKTCVRSSDTVARLGGDEFVVMLNALSSDPAQLIKEARSAAEKILTTLTTSYQLDSHLYRTTPSIGIAPFFGDTETVGDLLKQADLAMYQAKVGGRNTIRVFDPQMQAVVTARAALESDMRAALAQGEFSLHYQPQVKENGDVIGVEALARWTHPAKGSISPTEFIPVAEDTGLILTLGRWVLHTACCTLAEWQTNPRLRHLSMAVNVSSRQFRSETFVEDVYRILAVTGAPAKQLKLELTESVLVENVEDVIKTMEALRLMGVNFSLDDFGTGYSSLSYLKRMPLQQVKIDQSFVQDLLSDPNDAAIVDTIVALSAALGLDVIAEGVETSDQRKMLLRAGCMTFQGYLYSPPLNASELHALLVARDGFPDVRPNTLM